MIAFFCNQATQRFASSFNDPCEPYHSLTQDNNQPLRLYLLTSSRYPVYGFPFYYDLASGKVGVTAIVSLRKIAPGTATLASTAALTARRDGWEGLLHTNTQDIATFLADEIEKQVLFCVDLTDAEGNKTSPFRRVLSLRASDAGGAVTPVAGEIYLHQVTGFIGGGPTNLDGFATSGRALGTKIEVIVNVSGRPILSGWRIREGLEATDLAAEIIQPTDHHPDTNPRVLELVSGTAI